MSRGPFTFYEFFAGGGMARLGLGARWECLFANDFDPVKAAAYAGAHGADHLSTADVHTLSPEDMPGRADLAWASSPCQDFSLAGGRAGLSGHRSSALQGFWRLMQALGEEVRAPRLLVVENVTGLLSARGGADFAALCRALAEAGYDFGALEMDAAPFTGQSRPRVFTVARLTAPGTAGGARSAADRTGLSAASPGAPFHTRSVVEAHAGLPSELQARWRWWRLPAPPARNASVADLLEPEAPWAPPDDTERLLALMNPLHRARLAAGPCTAFAYRRVRVEGGRRVQRAEVRVDGRAGCLRTPAGGSSRQLVLVSDGERVRSRWLTPREGARLMGLPDDYRLPAGSTAAWRVIGDGVAVPVVRWLADHLLEPMLERETAPAARSAASR